jgi:hypothetical protein
MLEPAAQFALKVAELPLQIAGLFTAVGAEGAEVTVTVLLVAIDLQATLAVEIQAA